MRKGAAPRPFRVPSNLLGVGGAEAGASDPGPGAPSGPGAPQLEKGVAGGSQKERDHDEGVGGGVLERLRSALSRQLQRVYSSDQPIPLAPDPPRPKGGKVDKVEAAAARVLEEKQEERKRSEGTGEREERREGGGEGGEEGKKGEFSMLSVDFL